jgi:hypothetical protein
MADPSDKSHEAQLIEKGSSTSEDGPVERSKGGGDSDQIQSAADEQGERLNKSFDKEAKVADQDHEEVGLGPTQDGLPAEPPSEQPLERAATTPGEDYSVLTATQKKLVVMTASIASLFSPMATAIYCKFPGILVTQ